MRIEHTSAQFYNYGYNHNYKNNIYFGNKGRIPKFLLPKQLGKSEAFSGKFERIASYLSIDEADIAKAAAYASGRQLNFLEKLSQAFNSLNFYKDATKQDNPQIVLDIFKSVKRPTDEHILFAEHNKTSFRDIQDIFTLTGRDYNALDLANYIQNELYKGNNDSVRVIKEMLQSPYRDSYTRNIDDYYSYLTLNSNNKNAIKELDELLKTNRFSKKFFDQELDIAETLTHIPTGKTELFNSENLHKYYSKEGNQILSLIPFDNLPYDNPDNLKAIEETLLDIYRTTNADNISIRKRLINRLNYLSNYSPEFCKDTGALTALKNLFERTDENKHLEKFIDMAISEQLNFNTIGELTEILETVHPKKAIIFFDNLRDIVATTKGNDRIKALKEHLCDPVFETSYMKEIRQEKEKFGYIRKKPLRTVKQRLRNLFRVTRYKLSPDKIQYGDIPTGKAAKYSHAETLEIPEITNPPETIKSENPIPAETTFEQTPKATSPHKPEVSTTEEQSVPPSVPDPIKNNSNPGGNNHIKANQQSGELRQHTLSDFSALLAAWFFNK